jgi:hypothetical protein
METKVTSQKIPGDRLVLGLLSAFRTLVLELSRSGALDLRQYVEILQEMAESHKEAGDPNRLADAIRAISEHIAESATEADRKSH